jgi:hypothetical protein
MLWTTGMMERSCAVTRGIDIKTTPGGDLQLHRSQMVYRVKYCISTCIKEMVREARPGALSIQNLKGKCHKCQHKNYV